MRWSECTRKNSESRPVHRGQGGLYTEARPGRYTEATSWNNWPVHRGHIRNGGGPYTEAISSKTTPSGWAGEGGRVLLKPGL